jgi:hypothetical protein
MPALDCLPNAQPIPFHVKPSARIWRAVAISSRVNPVLAPA